MHVNQEAVMTVRAARERRADLYEAIEALEKAARAPDLDGRDGWRRDLRWALAQLAEAFHDHEVVSEGRGGTLEQIARDAPRLLGRVRALVQEHDGIAIDIHRFIDYVDLSGRYASTTELRERALRLCGEVARHRRASSDVMIEAYEVDIGGSGD